MERGIYVSYSVPRVALQPLFLIETKATEQYFFVVFYKLYKVVLSFTSVNDI